jgi:hypothetical protein
MDVQNKKIVVWDLDNCFEIELAKKFNIELFPNSIVKSKPSPFIVHSRKKLVRYPNIDKKDINVALKKYFFYPSAKPIKEDLGWADLLIHYTPEIITGPWNHYCEQVIKSFNNKNFITISSGSCFLNNDYPTDRTYFELSHFFSRVAEYCKEENMNTKEKKLKTFDALLGLSKIHRIFILENILKNKLEDNFFINIFKDSEGRGIDYRSKELDQFEDPVLIERTRIPNTEFLVENVKNGVSLSISIPTKIYKNSWYSIVAETNTTADGFFSEKTAKCFLAKRIFVFFGKQKQLKKLRELGYMTFNSIIDESYDEIVDDKERWELAFKEVLKLIELNPKEIYEKMDDVLEHNKRKLLNQTERLNSLKSFLVKHLLNIK